MTKKNVKESEEILFQSKKNLVNSYDNKENNENHKTNIFMNNYENKENNENLKINLFMNNSENKENNINSQNIDIKSSGFINYLYLTN